LYDIIPDIHGQSGKLNALLARLGWHQGPSGWTNDEPNREIVFLGDFIDRGPDNTGVLKTVRDLMDAGKAHAVMGNHELNAIHFHTPDAETGLPLRKHSEKNLNQHASFLAEFPLEDTRTTETINWMKSLPLFLEFGSFRAVHACWDDRVIEALSGLAPEGVLSEEQLQAAARKGDALFDFVETTAKGPEVRLPEGYSFTDKGGVKRKDIRVKWWNADATTWREIATSVPDLSELPESSLPSDVSASVYPHTAKPVFFGHYWLTGRPELQAPKALCLDYSAGTDGPLVAYRLDAMASQIDLANLLPHPG